MAWQKRTLTLDTQQLKDLLEHRDHDPRPFVRERAAALLKIAGGKSLHWVARQRLLKPRDPDTVYGWLDQYQAEGLAGLIAHQHGGFHGQSLDRHREEVQARLHRPPTGQADRLTKRNPDLAPCRYSLILRLRSGRSGRPLSGCTLTP